MNFGSAALRTWFNFFELQEGKYEEALKHFLDAHNIQGFKPDLSYNIALCYYKKTDYAQSLRYLSEIIERGIKDHPELSVGMATEGLEIRSVGNTLALQVRHEQYVWP